MKNIFNVAGSIAIAVWLATGVYVAYSNNSMKQEKVEAIKGRFICTPFSPEAADMLERASLQADNVVWSE